MKLLTDVGRGGVSFHRAFGGHLQEEAVLPVEDVFEVAGLKMT